MSAQQIYTFLVIWYRPDGSEITTRYSVYAESEDEGVLKTAHQLIGPEMKREGFRLREIVRFHEGTSYRLNPIPEHLSNPHWEIEGMTPAPTLDVAA